MKELSLEQKAKRYDEAIERAKSKLHYPDRPCFVNVIEIFPELKESGDEKIRKELLSFFTERAKYTEDSTFNGLSSKEIIAWLEKQGEQKPADKVEPKFKIGDWIINRTDATILQIVNNKDFYESVEIGGKRRTDTYLYFEWDFRLWTIQDAKDSDIICSRHNTESFEWIGIFKSLDKEFKRVFFYGFWNNTTKSFSVCGNEAYVLYNDFSPATKEQKEILFTAMADAGYIFDFEKKELKAKED